MRLPTVQTIAWFVDLHRKSQLDLTPPYQRWSVWNQAYRDYFVDTILNGFPMPPIFLHRETDPDGSTTYHVVDGRQRLETLLQYTTNVFPTPESYTPSAGRYFKDLSDVAKRAIWDYLVPVEFLDAVSVTFLTDVFDRLNRNVAQLKPQELRHARYNGAFITLTERLAEELPRGFPNISESDRRRMRAVEYVATLLVYLERGPQGTSQADLDQVYADWDASLPDLPLESRFNRTLTAIEDLAEFRPELVRSRLRNLGDYYSLFGAVADELTTRWKPGEGSSHRLLEFVNRVEAARMDETTPEADPLAHEYYTAVRSASNDAGPRQARIAILRGVLQNAA